MFSENCTQAEVFGKRFSIDIMKRNSQNIAFIVELLTQFCWIKLVPSEKAQDIMQCVLETIGACVHPSGAIIRCDGAPAFKSLNTCEEFQPILQNIGLKFELGQSMHQNKNPYAEIAIKEGHLAINKAGNPHNL